jgi:TolA-binding protein
MLKLGQSLLATGQKPEGCTALGALKAKFPDASDGTVAAATSARKAAGCVR